MNERMNKILTNPVTVPLIIGVVSFGGGVGLGYILGRKTAQPEESYGELVSVDFELSEENLSELKDENQLELEIEEEPELELEIEEEEQISLNGDSSEEINRGAEFLSQRIKESMTSKDEPEEVEPVPRSVFAQTDGEWDYDKEIANRTVQRPYVIHKDEFYEHTSGYTQSTLTYYEGDDILVDEEEVPVYNYEQITGPLLFGHGSGDANVFHVRNDKRKAEYEILRDSGHYAIEVLGHEEEDIRQSKDIKHSSQRKFRQDD
jgi:hypothetical protein